MALRAIFFDFNGVIVNDEPIHFLLFQKVLAEEGLTLNSEEYYSTFIGMDDRGCFQTVLGNCQSSVSEDRVEELIRRKARYYSEKIQDGIPLFPGVETFIRDVSRHCYVGLVSGALRSEILTILARARLVDCFQVIVSAEETKNWKPHPEGYLLALKLLNEQIRPAVAAVECVAVEDTTWGIEAAHGAGMKCLAITNSYTADDLKAADAHIESLENLSWEKTTALFPNLQGSKW